MAATRKSAVSAPADPGTPWCEARPHEGQWVDGRLNMNSYAAVAVFGLQQVAADLLSETEHARDVEAVGVMARALGTVVSKAMLATVGHDDLGSGAHTRARGVLRTALAMTKPFPMGGTQSQARAWMRAVTDRVTALLRSGIEMGSAEEPGVDFAAGKPWLWFAAEGEHDNEDRAGAD